MQLIALDQRQEDLEDSEAMEGCVLDVVDMVDIDVEEVVCMV